MVGDEGAADVGFVGDRLDGETFEAALGEHRARSGEDALGADRQPPRRVLDAEASGEVAADGRPGTARAGRRLLGWGPA